MSSRKRTYTLRLTETQMEQLRTYVRWAARDGSYFRPKHQFIARHRAIKEALEMNTVAERDRWDYE